jgi:hypothetical protein
MNDHNADGSLPFFMLLLEQQQTSAVAESPDTLSATDGGWCTGPLETRAGNWCILDTLKYPSDRDEQTIGGK